MYSIHKVFSYIKTWGIKSALQNLMYHIENREKKKRFGDKNPDKIVYVIRCINDGSKFYNGPVLNLLANYFYVLTHIRYANEKGYIPVIDQQNYPVYNNLDTPVNETMNAWEYYWQQPADISLDEAYQSKNVILSRRKWYGQWDMGYDSSKYTDPDIVSFMHSLCVPLNRPTAEYVQQKYDGLIAGKGRILGVCFRYGGHAKNCFYHGDGHPIQPEIEELADIVQNRLSTWNMDKVFMTSDSIESVEYFRSRFGDKLIVMPRTRRAEGAVYTSEDHPIYSKSNVHQTSLDYLAEMELLSRCDALIGSITSGFRYAVVTNNMKYENFELLERGFFEDNRKKGKH